jgi:hypothetical protein
MIEWLVLLLYLMAMASLTTRETTRKTQCDSLALCSINTHFSNTSSSGLIPRFCGVLARSSIKQGQLDFSEGSTLKPSYLTWIVLYENNYVMVSHN